MDVFIFTVFPQKIQLANTVDLDQTARFAAYKLGLSQTGIRFINRLPCVRM